MSVTLFGIPNCDTVKKAKKWLTQNDVDFSFHDFRKDGLEREWLEQAVKSVSWETLLNKRGTTFRNLSEQHKQDLDESKAIALMLEHPALIKRPVLTVNNEYHVGFKADSYESIFS